MILNIQILPSNISMLSRMVIAMQSYVISIGLPKSSRLHFDLQIHTNGRFLRFLIQNTCILFKNRECPTTLQYQYSMILSTFQKSL